MTLSSTGGNLGLYKNEYYVMNYTGYLNLNVVAFTYDNYS
jgi:hypothetical protein